jgi:NADPH2:quinone reductase
MPMRAVWLREFGAPDRLVAGEAPDPVAGPGEVLIDVAFANITFVETQFRATGLGPFKAELPMIPGNGVGGNIVAVGSGVDESLIGARVVSSTGGSGGYAELAAVPAEGMFKTPENLGCDVATALLADGRTAAMLVRAAQIQEGDRVVIEAAAGGVGSLLIQLANAAGATTIALVGSEPKIETTRGLGAAVSINYIDPEWTEHVHQAAGGADVVFDGVGGKIAAAAFELLGRGGRMLSFGAASGDWTKLPVQLAEERGVSIVRPPFAKPEDMRGLTESALEAAAAGDLRPVIGQRFPLDEAAQAHAAIESRATIAKTLLTTR